MSWCWRLKINIDVEVQRYAPLLAREVLKRAQGGRRFARCGFGRSGRGRRASALQGVNVNTTGGGSAGGGVSSGGGILTQLGPGIASLDPTLSAFANFSHTSSPQEQHDSDRYDAFVSDTRTYQGVVLAELELRSKRFDELFQPADESEQRVLQFEPLHGRQPGSAVDAEPSAGLWFGGERAQHPVQKNNLKVTDLQFKLQLVTTISAVLNLYWDLVSFHQT